MASTEPPSFRLINGEGLEAWMNETSGELGFLYQNLDEYFLIVMGLVIYFMQCGFAFLEAGAVRAKNTTNILLKNIMDSAIGGIVYWVCGFAFAFGNGSPFIGDSGFFLINVDTRDYAFVFFQFVFAATAATIVSGAMAERTEFLSYLIYSVAITGLVYPVVTHWAWSSTGWLANCCWWDEVSYQDFAGSGVVHCVGGAAGLAGAFFLGPRVGTTVEGRRVKIQYHTVPLMCLGGFILFFGFFAFNGGSQAAITGHGDGAIVGKAIINTVLSGSFAAISSMICIKIKEKRFSILACINGMLTGMVAICAGCNAVATWGAAIIGAVAGVTFFVWQELMMRVGIDDPLDAVAVHLGGGIWGVIAVTFFASDYGVLLNWNALAFKHLLWNFIGVVVIIAWTLVLSGLLFFALRRMGILRVSSVVEQQGLDISEHREPAYPSETFANHEMEQYFRHRFTQVWEDFHAKTNGALNMTDEASVDKIEPKTIDKIEPKAIEKVEPKAIEEP